MRGVSWDIDGSGVWVDHGCRADFAPGETDPDRDRDNGGSGTLVSCGSDDMHRHYCSAENTRAGVRMVKQRSASPCRQDYSWGFDDHGIWVDHGCRADFATETGPPAEESCLQSVGQARAHALVNQCIQVSPATHPPCNVQNPCSLIRDEIQRSCALLKNQGAPAFCRDYH